jgi:dTMP kinase
LFIVFEGVEGCGKSYQSRALYHTLKEKDFPVILTYEPGGTRIGNRIRNILKSRKEGNITPLTELFLISACRAQHVNDIILPALKNNKTVICDRFTGSTVAYQGYGRGLELSIVEKINRVSSYGLEPDLTILLDLPVDKGLSRKHSVADDRFEAEDIAFHERVRNGYLEMARDNRKWITIDARQSREEISDIIRNKINSYMEIEI